MDNRKNKVSFNIFKSFCKNTNLLIHDSQYSNQDMPEKKFWGHSLFTDTLKLSLEANVKHSYLFHHDPNKNKSEINKMVAYCNKQSRYTKFYPAIEKESINLLDN